MRSIATLIVTLCVAFSVTVAARAGAIGSPLNYGACGDLLVVQYEMSDPKSSYAGAPTPQGCEQLCKTGGQLCRATVDRVAGCYLRTLSGIRSFEHKDCKINTADADSARACRQNEDAALQSIAANVKTQRDASRDDCAAWAATCVSSCTP